MQLQLFLGSIKSGVLNPGDSFKSDDSFVHQLHCSHHSLERLCGSGFEGVDLFGKSFESFGV